MPLTLPEVLTGLTIGILGFAALHHWWICDVRPPMPDDDPIPWYGWLLAWGAGALLACAAFFGHAAGLDG